MSARFGTFLLVGWLGFLGHASAFVRQLASNGMPIGWRSGCVFLTPDMRGSDDLPFATIKNEIIASARNWTDKTASCSYLQVIVDEPVTGRQGGLDRSNLIIWLEDKWGRTIAGTFMSYSPEAPAQTTVFFVDDPKRAEHGAIIDADIELNGVVFRFGVVTDTNACVHGTCPRGQGCAMDVQNVMTHEIGHLLGLDHTCWDGAGTQPRDGSGQPVPRCATNLPPANADATLYNFAECNEIKKRSVEADDIAGICAAYPSNDDPRTCNRTGDGGSSSDGCATSQAKLDSPALLVLIALMAGLYRRARKTVL